MRSRRCLAGSFRKCTCDDLTAWLKPVSDTPTLDSHLASETLPFSAASSFTATPCPA